MPLAIDVGQRVLVYNPSHGWTAAYFIRAQQTNDDKLQILVSSKEKKKTKSRFKTKNSHRHVVYQIVIINQHLKIIIVIHLNVLHYTIVYMIMLVLAHVYFVCQVAMLIHQDILINHCVVL